MTGAVGDMANFAAVERDPVPRLRLAKNRIDRLQYRLGRAERDVERQLQPGLVDGIDALLEMLPHAQKGLRVGALKAVDRLLRIADRKDRADRVACALAGEELLGQRGDDLPLLGIGVLRLVDQDVVEAAIELEQHPRRHPRPAQQRQRGQHQIVEIEHALQPLGLAVLAQQPVAEPYQRASRLAHDERGAHPTQLEDPLGFRAEDFDSVADGLARRTAL